MSARTIRKRASLTVLLLSLLLMPQAAGALTERSSSPERSSRVSPPQRAWELGVGVQSAWPRLREAAPDGFALDEGARAGLVLEGVRHLAPRLGLFAELALSEHESSLPDVRGGLLTLSAGMRYQLLARGGLRPYLRGSIGYAQARIEEEDSSDDTLELRGLAGIFGLGVRLATSPRLQFALELDHGVINYRDASVTLENLYTGTRIDKTGRVTRLQFTLRWLI